MSKNLISLCLLTILLGVSLQQTPETCSLASTNPNQPVLNWLKRKNVTILEMPDKNVDKSICGGIWTEKGTCCKLDSIQEFIKKSNQRIADKWGRYMKRLTRIKTKLAKPFLKIIKSVKVTTLKSRIELMKVNKKMDHSFSKVYSIVPETKEQLESLQATMDGFDAKIQEFKTKGKECFDAMKTFRANMMCAVCSASASQYTKTQSDSEAMFKIDSASCSALVARCYPVWKFNFDLATMAQFFASLRAKFKAGNTVSSKFKSEKEVSTTDLETIKDDFAHCKPTSATDPTLTCDSAKTKVVTVETVTARFCSKLLSVTQENSYIEGDESIDEDIDDKDADEAEKTADETAKEETTSGPVASRILQTSDINIGVEVTNSGAYQNLLNSNSGLVPQGSVESSTAGDSSASKSARIVAVFSVMLACLFAL